MARLSDERMKQLMNQCGMPNSVSVYQVIVQAYIEGEVAGYAEGREESSKKLSDWESRHSNILSLNALLRQRPDFPVDRIPVYNEFVRLQEQAAALQSELAESKQNELAEAAEAKVFRGQVEMYIAELSAKQARIDSLMLEFCPDEMTDDQVEEWGKHQKPCDLITHSET